MATTAHKETPLLYPNILVTGTPGTGKTTLCQMLSERINLKVVNVGTLVKEKECHTGYDSEFDCYILDEDKLCDELEDILGTGGAIVDFHSCDFFPERWFHLVLVLRTDNTILFDRLKQRGYSEKKLSENVECEIMQVVLQEARDSYAEEIIHELESNTNEDMEANVMRISQWISQWIKEHNPSMI